MVGTPNWSEKPNFMRLFMLWGRALGVRFRYDDPEPESRRIRTVRADVLDLTLHPEQPTRRLR